MSSARRQPPIPLVGELARRTGAKAVTVDYRLGPEHPYPAAVEDAQAAYEGLLGQGIEPGQIALAGESAGGGLAVATLLALRDAGTPLPSCAFLMSPYADLTLSGDTHPREAGGRSDPHPRGPSPSGSGLRRRSGCIRSAYQPGLRRSPRATAASDPGGFARDPAQRRGSARGTGGYRRCDGHARGHARRSARVPGFCSPPRRGRRGPRPSIGVFRTQLALTQSVRTA